LLKINLDFFTGKNSSKSEIQDFTWVSAYQPKGLGSNLALSILFSLVKLKPCQKKVSSIFEDRIERGNTKEYVRFFMFVHVHQQGDGKS
jgi:hypothetical protein